MFITVDTIKISEWNSQNITYWENILLLCNSTEWQELLKVL